MKYYVTFGMYHKQDYFVTYDVFNIEGDITIDVIKHWESHAFNVFKKTTGEEYVFVTVLDWKRID